MVASNEPTSSMHFLRKVVVRAGKNYPQPVNVWSDLTFTVFLPARESVNDQPFWIDTFDEPVGQSDLRAALEGSQRFG